MPFKEVSNKQAAVKGGVFGLQGSGKTTLAALLALYLSKTYHDGAAVAMQDSEGGHSFLKPIFDAEGVKLLVDDSRAFKDLIDNARGIESDKSICALIPDSITHYSNDVMESYRRKKNKARLEFQDFAAITTAWQPWIDFFCNSRLHVITAGRLAWEWEFQERDDNSGKKDLVKGESKMRALGQFGYEPNLLIEMESIREEGAHGGKTIHRAHILKDKGWALNGKHFDFEDQPGYTVGYYRKVGLLFKPHFDTLNIGGEQKSYTQADSKAMFDDDGRNEYARNAQQKTIALEEIKGHISAIYSATSGIQQTLKGDLLHEVFGTRSWTKVESLALDVLQSGQRICKRFEQNARAKAPEDRDGVVEAVKQAKDELAADLEISPEDAAAMVSGQAALEHRRAQEPTPQPDFKQAAEGVKVPGF
jgi:hypothetical protein